MEDQTEFTAKPKRKRVSTYTAKVSFVFHFDNEEDAQVQIDKRRKIEALAKELGAVDVSGAGTYGSTMIDVK